MPGAHYLNKIYPLQDKLLQLFSEAMVRHYLTRSMALSRVYFKHRFLTTLNFFLNDDKDFESAPDYAINILQNRFEKVMIDNRRSGFLRAFIAEDEMTSTLDFSNDASFHYNGFERIFIY